MNEERDCVVLTETNRNNEVIVGLGLFMWIRTELCALDLCRLLCTLRLSLWDLTSFLIRNAPDVLGFFSSSQVWKKKWGKQMSGFCRSPSELVVEITPNANEPR